jgi:hypothetical protein
MDLEGDSPSLEAKEESEDTVSRDRGCDDDLERVPPSILCAVAAKQLPSVSAPTPMLTFSFDPPTTEEVVDAPDTEVARDVVVKYTPPLPLLRLVLSPFALLLLLFPDL